MSDEKKAALKSQLQAAREELKAAVADLTGDDWHTPVQADGDQWTALQMVRHLQDAQSGLTSQLERILAGQETVPRDFDINRWNARIQKKTAEAEMNAEQALENLDKSLAHLLTVVDRIQDEDWDKTGWQTGVQAELPVKEFVEVIATHEAGHARDIAVNVKKA